jgi:hypothetical protein
VPVMPAKDTTGEAIAKWASRLYPDRWCAVRRRLPTPTAATAPQSRLSPRFLPVDPNPAGRLRGLGRMPAL